ELLPLRGRDARLRRRRPAHLQPRPGGRRGGGHRADARDRRRRHLRLPVRARRAARDRRPARPRADRRRVRGARRRVPRRAPRLARVAARYSEALASVEGVETPLADDADHRRSWFVYVVKLAPELDRDGVMAALRERGIATAEYVPCIHLQPYMREQYGFGEGL